MRVLSAFAVLFALVASVAAQSPTDEQIPYQGVLSDGGVPLADGATTLQFALADADGGAWSETATVTTTDGAFAHRLGSVVTLAGIDFSLPVSITTTYTPAVGAPVVFGPTPLGAAPTAHYAQTAGGVTFPLVGVVSTQPIGAAISVNNTGAGAGISASSSGDAIRIPSAGANAIEIGNAADDGVHVSEAGENGVTVGAAGLDGVRVTLASENGLSVAQAGLNGVEIQNAGLDGIRIVDAVGDGVNIDDAGGDGVDIGTVAADGVVVAGSGLNGFNVGLTGADGLNIFRAGEHGVDIGVTGDTDADGMPEAAFDGVNVGWAGGDGFQVKRANRYGISADGDLGNFLRTSATGGLDPDLTLGGLASSDNGVISTDRSFTSSDLFVTSNDGVVFYIDDNQDADIGEFEVRRGDGTLLFKIKEDGTITPFGGTYGAESAVRIDDPTAPSARTVTLPSVVSSERLVAFSGNVTTGADGSAVIRLPAYADAVAGDFRYQLTVIGSFAQAIVGQEVSGGRFTVRTTEPGVKVSWRVEGVRQDAWSSANAHADVTAKERPGTYVHPEAYGAGPEQSAERSEDGPSEITAEGQARLAAEAAEAAEIEASVTDTRTRR